MTTPTSVLMPKATAVWLIEETALSFDQIAAFCGLHPLEVQGIANEEVAKGIRGVDPIAGGFLTREEIARGEANPAYRLKALEQRQIDLPKPKRKGARFVPTARRGDRPDAIAWMLHNHPEVPDSQIMKLLGTTKATIEAVRSKSHWNSSNIKRVDPVTIGLCTQIELDAVVAKAGAAKARDMAKRGEKIDGPTLMPASETGRVTSSTADEDDAMFVPLDALNEDGDEDDEDALHDDGDDDGDDR